MLVLRFLWRGPTSGCPSFFSRMDLLGGSTEATGGVTAAEVKPGMLFASTQTPADAANEYRRLEAAYNAALIDMGHAIEHFSRLRDSSRLVLSGKGGVRVKVLKPRVHDSHTYVLGFRTLSSCLQSYTLFKSTLIRANRRTRRP